MASMYETIMNLPLFKGASREQVSLFLEKTNIHFLRYEDGDVVANCGDPVPGIMCVMNGNVEIIHSLEKSGLIITEEVGNETVLCADRLFGLDTTFNCEIRAKGSCGVMLFRKEQYTDLLKTVPLFFINFINYLSFRAQRPESILKSFNMNCILNRVAAEIVLLTNRNARIIRVSASGAENEDMANLLNSNKSRLKNMSEEGIVSVNDGELLIMNRAEFLDSVQNDVDNYGI